MIDSPSYSRTASSDDTHTLFGQTMGYVAATAGLFALGAYLGRDLPYGFSFAGYLAALACLFCMNFTRKSGGASAGLLFAVGLLLGLSSSPMIAYYASTNPAVLWQAGGATALFIAGCGAIGYATRQDLAALGRLCWWALVALIIFGIVMIFAGLTMFDFQRLRLTSDVDSAPLMAASIFLDALNVFDFFLRLFSRNRE